jgi:tRNA (cmo5U34)-methyltransferase
MKKHVWQEEELAKHYLEGIRGGIPLAAEQLDVLLRIIHKASPKIERLLDLGCGDGILGRTIMAAHPESQCVFVDFSEHMIEEAKKKAKSDRSTFFVQDFGEQNWIHSLQKDAPFDLVLSGLAIHHQPDEKKRAIYRDIFDLLKPGGLFLHLEHVSSRSNWAKEVFEEYFVDSLWKHHQRQGGSKSRDAVAEEFRNNPGHASNILSPLNLQCQWLEEIGFVDVDCFFKLFEMTVFGGRKPE